MCGSCAGQCLAKEFHAGCGGLSKALRNAANPCEAITQVSDQPAFDIKDLDDPVAIKLHKQARITGQFRYIYLGIPCSTWSTLARMNGGSRTKAAPLGDSILPNETIANNQLSSMMSLIDAIVPVGGYWSIENPKSSMICHTQHLVRLRQQQDTFAVDVDQCMYGLAPPDPPADQVLRSRKATSSLSCKCDRSTSM